MKQILIKEQVLHIAKLANLQLSDEEVIKFQKQLSEILSYMKILKKVDTDKTKPTAQVTGLTNITREDETKNSLKLEKALSGTKVTHNGYFKVKSVLNN